MQNTYLRVKGIVEKDGKYLLLQRFVDDHIPEPFVWEFVEGLVNFGEKPSDAVLRCVEEVLSAPCKVEKILYDWSLVLGDSHCVGIAYLCCLENEDEPFTLAEEYGEAIWVEKEELEQYLENPYTLKDVLAGLEM
ncbi:MAG: NUDIX domain-containing protein [Lachnospiraceae bacterium]|nr:NUDIX domain-containing protein [Lachnospiraceae bacterium]